MSSREQFEAWASDEWKFPFVVERSGDSYKFMATQNKWEVWQAATNAMEARCAALAADNDTAMAALKQADEVVKSAYEKYVALADENMALKSARQNAMTLPETPATDAFLAEAWASGIDQWIASRDGRWNGTTVEAERFAAQLRQDANTAELVAAGIITRIED